MSLFTAELSDEVLAARIAASEPDGHVCFQQLYERHARAVELFLQTRFPAGAEDLLQETWLRVWQALPRQYAADHFRGWVFEIARNCLHDRLRKTRPTEETEWDQVPGRDCVEDTVLHAERQQVLAGCLEKLPARQREVVQARTGGEETEETCRRLQINSNAVYKLFHEARQRLAQCVERAWS